MTIDFKGKVVVITGAAGSIGAAMAERFAQDGAKVVCCVHRKEMSGENIISYKFDVSDREAVNEAIAKIAEEQGGIDVLVNNAGINVGPEQRKTVEDFSDEWWDKIIKVDLDGTYYCTKAAIPYMKPGSSIINISSIVGMIPLRNQCAFTAAKAGVINFTKAIAMELAPKGIRANVICPGTIAMNLTAALWNTSSVMDALLSHIPMERQGAPGEIADATAFLASDCASYITGAVLPVDGGWTCGGFARNF